MYNCNPPNGLKTEGSGIERQKMRSGGFDFKLFQLQHSACEGPVVWYFSLVHRLLTIWCSGGKGSGTLPFCLNKEVLAVTLHF